MRPLCYNKTTKLLGNGGFSPKQHLLRYLLITVLFLTTTLIADERYAFIYSKNIDDTFINFYDKVVVEADAIDNIYAIRHPKKMVAYVSVGEIEPWRKTKTKYKKSWIISKNRTWNSLIADLRKDAYQDFIFERIKKLYKQGYRNFFLDTMDAYHVTAKDKKLFKSQQKALVSFIHKLHKRYPNSKIIVNRGFELLKEIHKDIDAVVAESLLSRYNHDNKEYLTVPKKDRDWLLVEFKKAKKYGLDAISIDYTDKSTKERLQLAKKIKKLGVIPYITDGLLQEQGECEIERERRDILFLYNKSVLKDKNSVYSSAHLIASTPLEHWGYIPILYDISTKELPKRVEDRYHAVIVWTNRLKKDKSKEMYEWAKELKRRDIKILFLDDFGFEATATNLKEFGIRYEENHNKFLDPIDVKYNKPYKPYEITASIEYRDELLISKNSKSVISTIYKNGQKGMPIAITPWGGYTLGGAFLHNIENRDLLTINPFIFFKEALRLKDIPVPDPTTEAGRRILFIHIDGDGFVEPVRTDPKKLSIDYMVEQIYKKYKLPHTVSIIQGELTHLFPQYRKRGEEMAKELYKLPWIEPASHTLSHPFFWAKVVLPKNAPPEVGKHFHLPLKGYYFSLKKETIDSIDYVLNLAPKNKQKERILFWSGDCQPTREILEYTEKHGIITLNGGDTTIQKKHPTLAYIAPFGLERGEYWQIYTGQQNENVYTHDWHGPFWGFRNVIETYKMTNRPYRLKPINLYYHLYAASRVASFNALKKVYEWVVKQKTSKLYASQYIKKGQGFYRTAIAKIDGGYELRNKGFMRTVRFDRKISIDMKRSKGVAGFNFDNNSTYVILDSSGEYKIILAKKISLPYLIDSNGWVSKVDKNRFELRANMPIEANFYLPNGCSFKTDIIVKSRQKRNILSLSSKSKKGVTVVFKCK